MIKLKDDIYWAGYIDWDLRSFHGYSTPSGSTYNAYLIIDEKPTIIDTVKSYGFEEMISRIREIIDPAKIEYIVSNHTEMDHSGSIGRLLELCPNAVVVCSPKGEEGLRRHFLPAARPGGKDWKFKVVQTGEELSIGKRTLSFLLMPMVHWPDSMATYCKEEKILFSNDAFGQHYAAPQRFADEAGMEIAVREAEKYYANIVMPYGAQVIKVLGAVDKLSPDMICPSHGLIWRKPQDIERIVSLYRKWARYESDKRAVIIYDSMWHSTERMALQLFRRIEQENIPVAVVNLKVSELSDAVTQIMKSRVVIVGSAILNNHVLPGVGGFLTYIKGLKPKNRFAAAFGSYGWAPAAFKELEDSLREAGMEMLGEGIYIQYIPDDADFERLQAIVEQVKKVFL